MQISKTRVFQIIEKAEDGDYVSRIFDIGILILIFLNILAIILESHENLSLRYNNYFEYFEILSVIIFSIEYVLRLWTSDIRFHQDNKMKGILKQMRMPLTIVDLLAILPFYLPMLIPLDLRFLRIFRVARFFRILKLNRYSTALSLVLRVLSKRKMYYLQQCTLCV